jgi:hypothetical protein
MTDFVETADGTRIAYGRRGSGPVIVLIGGGRPVPRDHGRVAADQADAIVRLLGGKTHE